MTRVGKRVSIDAEAMLGVVAIGETQREELRAGAARVADALTRIGYDDLVGVRVHRSADTVDRAVGRGRRAAHRALGLQTAYIKPSLPFFPGRKYIRKVRKLFNGAGHVIDRAVDPSVFAWLRDTPLDPFVLGPVASLAGVNGLRYGDLLDLPGAVKRITHSLAHPENPPIWAMAFRLFTDEVDYGRQLLRIMRRQYNDWKRRIDQFLFGRPFEHDFTGSGRVAFGVSGIGSSWNGDPNHAPMGLDFGALGYERGTQEYYSYDGDGAFSKASSFQDIDASARLMDAQIRAQKAKHPGKPVDIYAHSQGGVVAMYWLKKYYNPADAGYPPIGSVVTIASPLQGTNLANSDAIGDQRPLVEQTVRGGAGLVGIDAPPDRAPSTRQMAVDSDIVEYLRTHRDNKGVPVHSLAADGDLVVPANQAALPGTRPRMIHPGSGYNDHSEIVDCPETIQAIRDAQSGRPERFRGLANELASAHQARTIGHSENVLGMLLSAAPAF